MGRREALEEARDELSAALKDPGTPPAAKASLSKELRAVWAELEAIEGAEPKAGSKVDELKKKRDARASAAGGAGTADRSPAARRSQPRRSNGSHRTS